VIVLPPGYILGMCHIGARAAVSAIATGRMMCIATQNINASVKWTLQLSARKTRKGQAGCAASPSRDGSAAIAYAISSTQEKSIM